MKSCRVHNHLRALRVASNVLKAARRARMRDTAARAESRARVPLFCVTVIFCILFCVVGPRVRLPGWCILQSHLFFIVEVKKCYLLVNAGKLQRIREILTDHHRVVIVAAALLIQPTAESRYFLVCACVFNNALQAFRAETVLCCRNRYSVPACKGFECAGIHGVACGVRCCNCCKRNG
nr:MAG TPA: hypothetical protein [Caudoviricetes sp.]